MPRTIHSASPWVRILKRPTTAAVTLLIAAALLASTHTTAAQGCRPVPDKRHTTVNGFPAYEEFTAESGHGEIHVLVADRFMIKVTAEGSDLRTRQNSAQQVPMAGIAALK